MRWQPGQQRLALLAATCVLVLVGHSAAQPVDATADDDPNPRAEPIEEITVVGRRLLRDLRLDVQAAREDVYGVFNELNGNEEFDIHCHDGAPTGTRMLRRVCRPQFVDDATSAAAKWYQACLKSGGWCFAEGMARAEMAVVPLKEKQFVEHVQRLTRENRRFRRAIAEYQAAERLYEEARRAVVIQASVRIIDTVGALPRGRSPLSWFPNRSGSRCPRALPRKAG